MNSVYDKVIANETHCIVLLQVIAINYSSQSFSFYWSRNELEHWRKQKPISQSEIKFGILSCCTNNIQNFFPKNYFNFSWNATVAWNWKSGFQEWNFLPKMDNLQR